MESCFKDLRSKKGPKKDHFSSLVLKRTKSLIKDLYASTEWGGTTKSIFIQKWPRYKLLCVKADLTKTPDSLVV